MSTDLRPFPCVLAKLDRLSHQRRHTQSDSLPVSTGCLANSATPRHFFNKLLHTSVPLPLKYLHSRHQGLASRKMEKRKFLFVSLSALIGDIAWQIVKEGHE